MIDYAKNIQAFYERDDYKALAGQSGATAVEASFKDLTYIPRKTKPLPGMMYSSRYFLGFGSSSGTTSTSSSSLSMSPFKSLGSPNTR